MLRLMTALIAMALVPSGVVAESRNILVSITAENNPISIVVQRLSEQSGVDIRLEPGATGTVQIDLTNATLESALSAIVESAGLEYTRVLVPEGTETRDISNYFASIRYVPRGSIVVEATRVRPATGILSGETAARLWNDRARLGLREVFWVHRPVPEDMTPEVLPEPEPTAPVTEEEEIAEEPEAPPTPENVYRDVTQTLSTLPPLEAFSLVEEIRQEVIQAMTPYELNLLMGASQQIVPYQQYPVQRLPLGYGRPSIRMGPSGFDPVISRPYYYPYPYGW